MQKQNYIKVKNQKNQIMIFGLIKKKNMIIIKNVEDNLVNQYLMVKQEKKNVKEQKQKKKEKDKKNQKEKELKNN